MLVIYCISFNIEKGQDFDYLYFYVKECVCYFQCCRTAAGNMSGLSHIGGQAGAVDQWGGEPGPLYASPQIPCRHSKLLGCNQ